MRNLAYRNKISNDVLRISIEGDDNPVILMFHWIREVVLRTVDWERIEEDSKTGDQSLSQDVEGPAR